MKLPANWIVAGIEETLLPFKNGQTLRQGWSPQCERFPAQTENDWGVLKTTAIQDGEFLPEHNKQLPPPLEPDPLLEVEEGDLLLTCAGPRVRCGVICLVKATRKRLMISGKMYRFRPEPRIALAPYVEAFLRSHDTKKRIDEMKTGISDSGLNLTLARFKTLQVPLPPVAEQQRIVTKIEELFSELDKGMESLKQARAQLAVYRQALLKHAFEGKLTAAWRAAHAAQIESADQLLARIRSDREARSQQQLAEWNVAILTWEKAGKVGKRPTKPRSPQDPDKPSSEHLQRIWPLPTHWQWIQIGAFAFVTKLAGFEYTDYVKYDDEGDMQVIKAENAGRNGFRVTNYSRIHAASVANLKRSFLMGGELLVVFVGAGTGNVATVPRGTQFFLGPNIAMARTESDAVNTRYLELFLRSPGGRDMILAASKAVAQPSLSMETIRQAPVAIPPSIEQQEIVRQLEENLDAAITLEAEIEANLQKAEALRQSILKKAFAGELVPQDPADEPASALLARLRAEREAVARNSKAKKPARARLKTR